MSDHFLLTVATDLSRPRVARKVVTCRNVRAIDRPQFRGDLAQSPLVTNSPEDVDDLADLYHSTLLQLWNKHAPEKEKVVPDRTNSPWIDEAVVTARTPPGQTRLSLPHELPLDRRGCRYRTNSPWTDEAVVTARTPPG